MTENDSGQKLIKLLTKHFKGVPASYFYRQLRKGNVKLNGKKANADAIVCVGDCVNIYRPPSESNSKFYDAPKGDRNKALEIFYEDDNILVAIKPAGMHCHPDLRHKTGTLVDYLLAYLIEKGDFLPEIENSFVPALCNRLDVNTSGFVLMAKNAFFLRELNKRIAAREVRRVYSCQTTRLPDQREGVIDAPLFKDHRTNISYINNAQGSKWAVTKYRVVDPASNSLEVEIISGRSHQIRVHLASIGCPLKGDVKYGGGKGKLCLQCRRMEFDFELPLDSRLEYLNGRVFEAE